MQCENCGHENLDTARFCAGCGVPLSHPTEGEWIGRLVGGRFRVTRVLGEGGMGVVYAAEQQMGSTVRKAAIKTLHPHLSKDPSVLQRFHRECGTVAQLEHPNTIKVFDFGAEADGTLYIAMEFVEGRSLDKVIEAEGPLPPQRVVDILDQIAGALHEAHEQGIVHRDLKPENVILGEKLGRADFVKVLDFGIAARSESADRQKEQKLTQQGMVLGTPPYMSPEQFTGAELDRRSDIYSLGVMTYEMLTGTLPFNATTPWQWATEHMTAQPFPIEQRPTGYGVPKSMREVVMRSLAKNPADRPASALEFVGELRAGMAGATISGTGPTQAMQAAPTAAPSSRAGVDTAARTGVMPAEQAALLRSPEAPSTEAGLSAMQPAQPKRSNVGLLVGALGAVVALGIGAWFFGQGQGGEPATTPEGEPSATPTAVEPPPPTTPPPVTPPPPLASAEPQPTPPVASGTASSPSGPSPTTPAPQPSGSSSTPGPTKPPPAAPVPCSECIGLVNAGSWSRASQAYASCDSAGKKQCNALAKRAASVQVEQAAKSKKCSGVPAIVRAATAMDADTPRLKTAAASCK